MKNVLIFISLFLIINQLASQSFAKIKDVDILDDKRIVLERESPHSFDTIAIENVFKINDKHSKIIYRGEGVYSEAIVNSGRKDMLLIATAIETKQDNMPKVVMDAFKRSEYASWRIDKTLSMKTPHGSWFYAIDIAKNDKQKRIFYDHLGKFKIPPY